MTMLRTPEERFAALSDAPFAPHYVTIADPAHGPLRMHFVDEGPRDAPIVFMLHGEPTWSYLYRKVIKVLCDAGVRAIAPDLIGFGKSDKLDQRDAYSYAGHVAWAAEFLRALALEPVTLLCQDWGGLIGLRLLAEESDRFAGAVITNTSLPTGDRAMPDTFAAWQRQSQEMMPFDAGAIVAQYCAQPLAASARRAYDAPFPSERHAAAARAFPMLVPCRPDDPASAANRAAWERLAQFQRPVLTVFGDSDPFSSGLERVFQKRIPGAAGQAHRVLQGVGHFIQEDAGEELGRLCAAFVKQQ
jgi:haloalkane dehalogenase